MDKIIKGIYKITSPSSKIYIGQTINFKNRLYKYKCLNCKGQFKLYNSLKKYGPENHKFETIEECSLEQLNEKEIFWKTYYLNQFNNNWDKVLFCNLYDVGCGPMSKETKLKISNSLKGRKCTWLKNQKRSSEIGKKISKSNTGIRKPGAGPKGLRDKKIGQKISKSKYNPILQYNLQGNFIKEWDNGLQAGKYINKHPGPIHKCCKGEQNKAYKFIWKKKLNNGCI
jgi:group I intron endonuclease